jgi:lipopolysaccharide/colanic/teichoic acid biosynthesis glycosyltransferase
VFFLQERVGLNKRRFRLVKFRTMVVDAEQRLAGLESMNEVSGPVFKIKKDPRVTPIGRLLRKSSLDELPQLINVLKGDMSLVGPRPLAVRDYRGITKDWQRRRLSVMPGITCLWQVQGRSSIPFEQWMELDLQYIDNWSLLLDLKICLKTIPAVVSGNGAA